MTKVKQSKSRKSGTASVAAKEQKALEGKTVISAEKNGQTRSFAKNIWDHLPEDKQGWKEVTGKPADINASNEDKSTNKTKKLTDQQLLEEARKSAVEAYFTKFGKNPEEGMTIQEIGEAIDGADDDDNDDDSEMIDHVVTQEDLDLDPELAKSGVKVGETIQVAKPTGGTE